MIDPDPDPKAAGLGGDAGTSADVVMETHKAVRELLLALESLSPPAGVPADTFDAFRGKAQVARRRLEDIDADVRNLKDTVSVRVPQTQVISTNGAPEIHIHLHLTVSPHPSA